MKHHDSVPLMDHVELPPEQMLHEAWSFLDRMKQRHTVREFSDRPVDRGIIEAAIAAAGRAPSGANHQPWHFCAIGSADAKRTLRELAEKEEREFYGGKAGDAWLDALAPLGTDAHKPFLETAPWLIVIFLQRYARDAAGGKTKHYYTDESVGIATGMLITALHLAGLATLTHTPSPMGFLNDILARPRDTERPYLVLVTGHAATGCTVPAITRKPLDAIATFV